MTARALRGVSNRDPPLHSVFRRPQGSAESNTNLISGRRPNEGNPQLLRLSTAAVKKFRMHERDEGMGFEYSSRVKLVQIICKRHKPHNRFRDLRESSLFF